MTLYELTNEFRRLTEVWDDKITDEEFAEEMDSLNQEFSEKIKNCAFYIKNLGADVTAIDAEMQIYESGFEDGQKITYQDMHEMKADAYKNGYLDGQLAQQKLNNKELEQIKANLDRVLDKLQGGKE